MVAFETITYGKWILAGEHAVLRGYPALAFPLLSRSLHLKFTPEQDPTGTLHVEFKGPNGDDLKLLFHGVIENALSRLKVKEPLLGQFELTNSLPVGAGMGASAALCGAVARWCEAQGWVEKTEVYEFACRLEDLFHGESSGVDIAVSLSAEGVRFVRGGKPQSVPTLWWPKLYLSYCGQRGMTSDCVNRVKRMFETDRPAAEALDKQMDQAVELAGSALASPRTEGLPMLKRAMDLSYDCFNRWGLCQGDLGSHLGLLRAGGALAVKPTGSGGGGYSLSLWDVEPPEDLRHLLLPVPHSNL